jgi:hypothetical protein
LPYEAHGHDGFHVAIFEDALFEMSSPEETLAYLKGLLAKIDKTRDGNTKELFEILFFYFLHEYPSYFLAAYERTPGLKVFAADFKSNKGTVSLEWLVERLMNPRDMNGALPESMRAMTHEELTFNLRIAVDLFIDMASMTRSRQ